MSLVIENLKDAIKGESNAKRKYEMFAEQAEKEGLPEISHLFKAVSFAESIHIKNHLKSLSIITKHEGKLEDIVKLNEEKIKSFIKDTSSNLINAIEGELYETNEMYKNFVKNAKKSSSDVAELSFSLARNAEKVHAKLYSQDLKTLDKNAKFESLNIYVCTICGNVEVGALPKKCFLCGHENTFFEKK